MSKFGWFLAGLGLGALALKQYQENPKAQEAVDDIYAAAKEFGAAVAAGYQERESELSKPAAPKKPATKPAPAKRPAAKKATGSATKKS